MFRLIGREKEVSIGVVEEEGAKVRIDCKIQFRGSMERLEVLTVK